MKILFLGTGAADYDMAQTDRSPDKFRRFSSALIDGTLLIDPGPAVPDAIRTFGVDKSAIKTVVLTHPHGDHFAKETLDSLVEGGAEFVSFQAGETKQVGRYKITALAGNHATAEYCLHYLIDDGKSSLFYGLDGAWLLYPEIAAIKERGVTLAVLDATIGEVPGDYRIFEHNSLAMVRIMKETLAPYVGRFVVSHLALTLHAPHPEVSASLAQEGITVACDGMTIEF